MIVFKLGSIVRHESDSHASYIKVVKHTNCNTCCCVDDQFCAINYILPNVSCQYNPMVQFIEIK